MQETQEIEIKRLEVVHGEDRAINVIALYGGGFAGTAELSRLEYDFVWMHSLFVSEALRRKGIARLIVEATFEVALERKSEGVSLAVKIKNNAARTFYESMGFVKVHHYEDGEHYMYTWWSKPYRCKHCGASFAKEAGLFWHTQTCKQVVSITVESKPESPSVIFIPHGGGKGGMLQ